MFFSGPRGFAALSAAAPSYHDDTPVLEYATAGVHESQANELLTIDLLRTDLEPVTTLTNRPLSEDALVIEEVRRKNLADIVAVAHLRQATAMMASGNHARAADLYMSAWRAHPESGDANRNLGDLLTMQGRPAEAEPYHLRALAARPDDPLAQRGLALALLGQGRSREAIPHYRAALSAISDDAEGHNNLGAALAREGDLEGAIRHFARAVELRPDYMDARQNLNRTRAASRRAESTN